MIRSNAALVLLIAALFCAVLGGSLLVTTWGSDGRYALDAGAGYRNFPVVRDPDTGAMAAPVGPAAPGRPADAATNPVPVPRSAAGAPIERGPGGFSGGGFGGTRTVVTAPPAQTCSPSVLASLLRLLSLGGC